MVDDHAKDSSIEVFTVEQITGDANKTEEKQQFTELQKPPTKTFQSKHSQQQQLIEPASTLRSLKKVEEIKERLEKELVRQAEEQQQQSKEDENKIETDVNKENENRR